jgi:GNAT superfamily N-acetyltransferase
MDFVVTDGDDQRFVRLCRELDDYLNTVLCAEKQKEQYARYNIRWKTFMTLLCFLYTAMRSLVAVSRNEPGVAVFTNVAHRHCGCGKIILQALEKKAGDKGYKRLVLETGNSLETAQKYNPQLWAVSQYAGIDMYGKASCSLKCLCADITTVALRCGTLLKGCRWSPLLPPFRKEGEDRTVFT